jgi:hypothetical protein
LEIQSECDQSFRSEVLVAGAGPPLAGTLSGYHGYIDHVSAFEIDELYSNTTIRLSTPTQLLILVGLTMFIVTTYGLALRESDSC